MGVYISWRCPKASSEKTLRSSGLSDEQTAEVAVTAAGHAAGWPEKTACFQRFGIWV